MTSPSGRMTTADLANADPRTTPAPAQTQTVPTPTPAAVKAEGTARDEAAAAHGEDEASPLFAQDSRDGLMRDWDRIQSGFVDEPRRAVADADALVAETMKKLADTFARERANLEHQWGQGGEASTEDLRLAFRRYRSFFKRLLSV